MARIVVIDDELEVRQVIRRFLEGQGHDVILYADASLALENEGGFTGIDLIISDLLMPMPGDQFLMALMRKQVNVPVIILSGRLSDGIIELLDLMGAAATVEKPISFRRLTKAMQQVLARA